MSEIKPVYQRYCSDGKWLDINQARYVEEVEADCAETRILYPAAAYEALQKEKTKIEDELDEYKEHHEELTEHYRALQFLESEFRKENESLNAEVFRLKNELITSLKDWHDLNANNAALQKEVAELQQNLESEKLANTRLAEIIKENNNKMSAGVYTTNEQYAKEVKEHDDLLTAIEALEIKYEGALDSIRQYKQILDGVPEGAFDGGWTARGIMKHAADLEKENADLKEEVKILDGMCTAINEKFAQSSESNAAQAKRIEEAVSRIKDMLENDDGQAHKEARKFIESLPASKNGDSK